MKGVSAFYGDLWVKGDRNNPHHIKNVSIKAEFVGYPHDSTLNVKEKCRAVLHKELLPTYMNGSVSCKRRKPTTGRRELGSPHLLVMAHEHSGKLTRQTCSQGEVTDGHNNIPHDSLPLG